MDRIVVFTLDQQRYGLDLHRVLRVVRAVEPTPIPQSPDLLLGVINVQGKVIPLYNIRKCFRLPEREIQLTDQMIIALASERTVAFIVDAVTDVMQINEAMLISAETILPGMELVQGVVKLQDGLILIENLDRILSLDEEWIEARGKKQEARSKK